MPIYEYQCQKCQQTFQVLIMNSSEEEKALKCPKCGCPELKKLISLVSYHVSEADRLANYDPKAQKEESFYKDTRNIGLHAKWRAKKMGVDLGPSFEEKMDKLRTDPGSVIRDSEGDI